MVLRLVPVDEGCGRTANTPVTAGRAVEGGHPPYPPRGRVPALAPWKALAVRLAFPVVLAVTAVPVLAAIVLAVLR